MSRERKLLFEMLDVIEQLGECPMARIDARAWYQHFRRKVRRLTKTKR